ncbi:DUF4747 family protein [Leptospira montravelensis]|uniref:DUF4747 family protein n=1 Tax=Leptospira montravelensis TaxID=2484961 RepID=UPI00108386CA|nr:DUF4747 family protein [Leptospira montravelensis]TGK82995.1 DUF4747 family protein [Leptospira montravelensis]
MKKSAKKKQTNKPKKKKADLYALNIKFIGTKVENYDYLNFFQKLVTKAIPIEVSSGIYLWFRKPTKIEYKEGTIITGKFSRFTKIEGKNWIDINKNESIEMKLREGIYPNHYETEYIFIPSAHRVVFKRNRGITINMIQKSILPLIEKKELGVENFSVNIENNSDYISEILDAKSIFNLEFKITPSNLDILDEASQFIDSELHKGNIGYIQGKIEARGGGSIDGTSSKLVNGLLGSAKSNGQLTAKIEDSEGKIKRIKTEQYPRKFTVEYLESENEYLEILKKILSIFR